MGWVDGEVGVGVGESVVALVPVGEASELGCAMGGSGLDEDEVGCEAWGRAFCSWDGGGLLRPFAMVAGSEFSCGGAVVFPERSIGFETFSKLEVSSSSAVSASSLSANLLARLAMELVCSFMDGDGPWRFTRDGSGIEGSSSGAFFVGEGIFAIGAFVAGL